MVIGYDSRFLVECLKVVFVKGLIFVGINVVDVGFVIMLVMFMVI